jgi:hypothetical protein
VAGPLVALQDCPADDLLLRGALGLGERIECLLQLLVGTDGECYVAMVSV